MASTSFQSSNLELWRQPEIKKPEPLRIVKERANTIAGCGSFREVPIPRRGSVEHYTTRGLSPDSSGNSLTIFKRRKARGSVLGSDLERNICNRFKSSEMNRAAELQILHRESNSTSSGTPRSSSRISSAGSFLKSELFSGSSESELSISCPQAVKVYSKRRNETFNPLCLDLFPSFNVGDLDQTRDISSTPSQKSKSAKKRLVSKAFDGIGNVRSKSMHFMRSKSSREYPHRQASLRNLDLSLQTPSKASSREVSLFSFDKEKELIRDSRTNSVTHADNTLLQSNISFILFPEVTVVPEVEAIKFGSETSLWVAVVVTGVLRKTVVCDVMSDTLATSKKDATLQGDVAPESNGYGYLYGMDVKLTARKDCALETVVTEPNQPRRLYLGQAELILAKVKIFVSKRSSSHVRESSKELIADLESQLGNATTDYLTVEVSYKQSVFPTSRDSATTNGLSYHTTTLITEAHAVIKRYCSESSWSCHISENLDASGVSNRLFPLITSHCSPNKAARLISKIVSDPLSHAELEQMDRNTDHFPTSSDAISLAKGEFPGEKVHAVNQSKILASELGLARSLDITQAGYHDPDHELETLKLNPCSDLDPARKIWLDMRKDSRGIGRRESHTTEIQDLGWDGQRNESDQMKIHMREEQAKLIKLALKNKRSLGAETLRSMAAPSTSMTLGMGRGWGWSPPWW